MLVKFLSFIASVLSNARYKTILIPCIALVLSLTSLSVVALVHNNNPDSPASSTSGSVEALDKQKQSVSPHLSGLGKQDLKDGGTQQNSDVAQAPDSSGDTGTPPTTSPQNPATPPAPAFDIALSTSAIELSSESTSSALTASTVDGSNVTWSAAPEAHDTNITVLIDQSKDAASSFTFRLRAGQHVASGTYQFTVTAKDAVRGINVSKQITVTVS